MNGVQEAAGSNPVTRTKRQEYRKVLLSFGMQRQSEPAASCKYNPAALRPASGVYRRRRPLVQIQSLGPKDRSTERYSCLLVCSVRVNQRPLANIIRPPCGRRAAFTAADGRWFKSSHSDQKKALALSKCFFQRNKSLTGFVKCASRVKYGFAM